MLPCLLWIAIRLPASGASVPAPAPATAPGPGLQEGAASQEPRPLEIARDTKLDPRRTYGPLVIKAGNVTVDGQGAQVVGAAEGPANRYSGVGIAAAGVSGVKLRNVRVRGFAVGLRVEDGADWTVEDCDFSDNFHDPDFGWGEQGEKGGIVLVRVRKSTLRRNKANRVWDGCSLRECHENVLEENDFSRCSNTCLKLWNSCRNEVRRNNLSWGLRISPGEVHARDSASVLVESGSDGNRFLGNDCTHGGDGIFVRVLNGWVSKQNVFEGNDCSHANNNAVEAWAPENIWRGNKANHSSYGFWLGASDKTVLVGNEAAFNGRPDGFHNSPHLPDAGHAGVVFMFGPSSHTLVDGNHVHDNNGAGIALIGDLESAGARFKAFHWVIQRNRIERNRWGIYVQHADWVDVGPNLFAESTLADLFDAGGVTNLFRHDDPSVQEPPSAVLAAPRETFRVGRRAAFDATGSRDPSGRPLRFRWDLGDGTVATEPRVAHEFAAPGFYRIGLTVHNGALADLRWFDAYVVEDVPEVGTEGEADRWTVTDQAGTSHGTFRDDRDERICGRSSLFALVDPYSGMRVNLLFPAEQKLGLSLEGKRDLVFWLRWRNPNLPAWQDLNPIVTLYESPDISRRFLPARDLLSSPRHNEGRDGWNYFVVPLEGSEEWKAEGNRLRKLNWLTLGFDSWGAPPLRIWVDGLAVK